MGTACSLCPDLCQVPWPDHVAAGWGGLQWGLCALHPSPARCPTWPWAVKTRMLGSPAPSLTPHPTPAGQAGAGQDGLRCSAARPPRDSRHHGRCNCFPVLPPSRTLCMLMVRGRVSAGLDWYFFSISTSVRLTETFRGKKQVHLLFKYYFTNQLKNYLHE